ncbi:YpjP-like protein [Lentibacillus persicus]|uniref:YpjP-like protein n=1 Tax=Lentibacillus persicus TaxID=640948 RepID=A0A1I1UHE0_9BACI|nr:YpjP family protein [Lentibacillus persicus]SFD70292.1 YpjP-like protein [Lentibacillus persicus]
MKLWMRKLAVALVAVVTLGIYIPEIDIEADAEQSNETAEADQPDKTGTHKREPIPELNDETEEVITEHLEDDPMVALHTKAVEQTMVKMGPRIAPKVEDDFQTVILPRIEDAIQMITKDIAEDDFQYLTITEQPSDGVGERIFNIYDERSGTEIARFDVRRENRPLEGYWFNFHYHIKNDGFENHHDIGEIYWDKNTPPKWMS